MSKLYKANGNIEDINPVNGSDFTLEELQKAVGGYIELVHLNSGELMIVDDEGTWKSKPINDKASRTVSRVIRGDVVVCERSQFK